MLAVVAIPMIVQQIITVQITLLIDFEVVIRSKTDAIEICRTVAEVV